MMVAGSGVDDDRRSSMLSTMWSMKLITDLGRTCADVGREVWGDCLHEVTGGWGLCRGLWRDTAEAGRELWGETVDFGGEDNWNCASTDSISLLSAKSTDSGRTLLDEAGREGT